DVDLPLAWSVELAEEDALPRPEGETAVADGDEHLRAHEGRADVRGSVLLALLDVLPAPVVPDHLLERRLEVTGDRGVGVLVDRHARGGVRDVDQGGRGV